MWSRLLESTGPSLDATTSAGNQPSLTGSTIINSVTSPFMPSRCFIVSFIAFYVIG